MGLERISGFNKQDLFFEILMGKTRTKWLDL
jgi:hypothetical protein